MSLRNVADFSLKEGSRIFKQRAPEQDLSNFSLETERNASRARRRGDLPAGKAGQTSASPRKKSRSPIWCLYCTKLEPISKTNDVARSARVVKRN